MKISIFCLLLTTSATAFAQHDIAIPLRMAHASGSISIDQKDICEINISVPVYPLRDPNGPILHHSPAYLDCKGEVDGKTYVVRAVLTMAIRNATAERKWLDAVVFVNADSMKGKNLGVLNGGSATALNERYLSHYADRAFDKKVFAITVHIDDWE